MQYYPQLFLIGTCCLVVHCFVSDNSSSIRKCTSDKEILETLLQEYKFEKRPNEFGAQVRVEIWVQEVTGVNELTSDFLLDIYVSEFWVDHALNYEKLNPCKRNLSLTNVILKQIWKPNTVFINTKFAKIHNSPFTNVFLMIYPNGTVWTNFRMKLIGPCVIDFTTFPMDKQKCFLTIESFSYNHKEAQMIWNPIEQPVSILKNKPVQLPDFTLVHIATGQGLKRYPAGTWNQLYLTFYFRRRYGWYVLQAYIPTYLTIFVSWINFCLGIKMIPARTMICVNSLLALIFQFGNVMRNLPKVSYVKALDVWMLSCLTFVFASVVELALVAYWTRDDVKRNKPQTKHKTYQSLQTIMTQALPSHEKEKFDDAVGINLTAAFASQIDRCSCFLFPACFAIFNIVYWAVYLSISYLTE